jgi:GAF domain-containing protein/uncharacterized Zn finger protein (UPF0148 family)
LFLLLWLIAMASVDQSSILGLDRDVPLREQKGELSKKRRERGDSSSVSAAIARENARLGMPGPAMPRFPGEDAGQSLAEMARADLDAALQLLADRAQYITGASGAAIALRRGEHSDMLCRARVGSNAPELGALLSMEYGLSGESVRTGQLLRCDDAERDSRVNRDLCRELGIASVVIMPILKEQQVLGIFELLSGKAAAFNEHDLSALARLVEMVVTAVKHSGLELETVAPAKPAFEHHSATTGAGVAQPQPEAHKPAIEQPSSMQQQQKDSAAAARSRNAGSPKKPLFWSAALQTQAGARAAQAAEGSGIPAVLRTLKNCQACGFPISQGRTFCVECEEKQWHGRSPAQAKVDGTTETARSRPQPATQPEPVEISDSPSKVAFEAAQPAVAQLAMAAAASAAGKVASTRYQGDFSPTDKAAVPNAVVSTSPEASGGEENSTLSDARLAEFSGSFLSSAVPSESWLAANKYILIALFIVALILAAIAHFH